MKELIEEKVEDSEEEIELEILIKLSFLKKIWSMKLDNLNNLTQKTILVMFH